MRILIAHSFYKTFGGEDRYVGQQMKLLEPNHDVALLERSNIDLTGDLRTAAAMTYSWKEKKSVKKAIDEFEPDLIHVHNPYPSFGPAVHLAAFNRVIPLVATIHNFRMRCPNSLMFTEGTLCRRCEGGNYTHAIRHRCFPSKNQAYGYATSLWIHRFVLRLENKVDHFIVPSRFMQDQLASWEIPVGKTSLVPNFTEVSPGKPSAGSFGLYFGRLSAEKGLDDLVAALKISGDPPFQIVGDGPLEQKLRDMINGLGLVNVKLAGRLPPEDLPAMLQDARFVVLPSISHENAPLAALEAMAAARPLLVSDRGGLPELVDGGAGVICNANDARDLASKIMMLMNDPARCQEAGERALRRAQKDFNGEAHLKGLEDAYHRTIADSDRYPIHL